MNYYEHIFTYTSPIEMEIINDLLAAELGIIGFESFVETYSGLKAYIPEKIYNEDDLLFRLETFPLENIEIHFTKSYIESLNWNEEWEKNYFQPITVGKECVIRASFHQIKPNYKYDIIIDPKMAFGTGNHETTWLMINEILKLDLQGKEFLDMGCGTAVLAILAAKKGVEKVVAIDIDEWAYNNALENICLNDVNNIEVVLGNASKIKEYGRFDLVFANINRNILLADIRYYVESMKKNASLFMSGFYKEDKDAIESECKKWGMAVAHFSEKNNWVAVEAILL